MDICGPLMTSKRGKTVLLVITDHFSKYTETFELPDQKATTIAEVLVNKWFHVHGEPHGIHNGQVCDLYGITKTQISPYHLQGDGQYERI